MVSLVVSTIVFFVASFFLKRYFEEMGIPKGMTRAAVVFTGSMLLAYGSAAAIDWLAVHL